MHKLIVIHLLRAVSWAVRNPYPCTLTEPLLKSVFMWRLEKAWKQSRHMELHFSPFTVPSLIKCNLKDIVIHLNCSWEWSHAGLSSSSPAFVRLRSPWARHYSWYIYFFLLFIWWPLTICCLKRWHIVCGWKFTCVFRPKVNLKWCSSGAVHPWIFETGSLTGIWGSPIRLSCLARGPQAWTCLCLLRTGITNARHYPGVYVCF